VFIGTFYFTSTVCSSGGSEPPLRRTVEVHGPCVLRGINEGVASGVSAEGLRRSADERERGATGWAPGARDHPGRGATQPDHQCRECPSSSGLDRMKR
jgi:hypothetical protein